MGKYLQMLEEAKKTQLPRVKVKIIHSRPEFVGETDEATNPHEAAPCKHNADTLKFPLPQMGKKTEPDDDRRTCNQCRNLGLKSRCRASDRREIAAIPPYYPNNKILQRCGGYLPNYSDKDKRTGKERWPYLMKKNSKV